MRYLVIFASPPSPGAPRQASSTQGRYICPLSRHTGSYKTLPRALFILELVHPRLNTGPSHVLLPKGYNQQSRFSLCKPRSWAFGKLAGTTYRLNFARKESPKVTVRNKEPEGATGLEPTTSSVTEVLTNGNTPPDCFDNERNSLCLGNAGRSQLRLQETSVQ